MWGFGNNANTVFTLQGAYSAPAAGSPPVYYVNLRENNTQSIFLGGKLQGY